MTTSNVDLERQRSQRESVKTYLMSGRRLTAVSALALFGCFRLPSRIHELRRSGMDIRTNMIRVPTRDGATARVAEYFLPLAGS